MKTTSFNSKASSKGIHTYKFTGPQITTNPETIDTWHIDYSSSFPTSWFEIIKIVSIQFLHVDLAKQVSIIFKTCCSCLCKVNMLQWERKHLQNTSFHKHLWHSFFISSIYFFCLYVSCVFGVTTMLKVLIGFFVFLLDRKSQKRSTRLRWHMRKLQ